MTSPSSYCALNFALNALTPRGEARLGSKSLWCMTEYSRGAGRSGRAPVTPLQVTRAPDSFVLGSSSLQRTSSGLNVSLDEPTKPFFQLMPSRVVGTMKLTYDHAPHEAMQLDARGEHHWMGVAPHARLSVKLNEPQLSFEGSAYHDSNWGEGPLEDRFDSWTWSRAETPLGTLVLYDVVERERGPHQRALLFHRSGEVESIDALDCAQLKRGGWGVSRSTRADAGGSPSLHARLIDSPFYTRDLINTQLLGYETIAMHESLDLRRFQRGWVRFLLPFRMRIR